MIDGQSVDLALEGGDVTVGTHRYLSASRKTGALIAAALGLGAIAGRAAPALERGAAACGEHLGLAWQMMNDYDDIRAVPARTGKPPRGDLRNGRLTYPVLAALRCRHPAAGRLRTPLFEGDDSPESVELRVRLLEDIEAPEMVLRSASRHFTSACHRRLPMVYPPGSHRRRLAEVFHSVVGHRLAGRV